MDFLCDDLLLSILCELDDPTPLIRASKRLYALSQDPYVRAHYFLSRYGHVEALYWAFTRGKLVSPKMLDILITSGAHLSRYFAQVAIHFYFRVQKHSFIKSPWVRSLSFPTFVHFQSIAANMYGHMDVVKNEDDGSIFATFLKERKYPPSSRSVDFNKLCLIFEKYKFIPFCAKDPHLAQLPLAFAVEPRLIPLAVANGFVKDSKYRDFVFRKMFEKMSGEDRVRDIVNNVTEMCRVDPDMYLTRTVASEIFMDLKNNPEAYAALKKLANTGQLGFQLANLATDLLKSFFKSSSVTSATIKPILRQIYLDFPCADPVVRNVMLSVVFVPPTHNTISTVQKFKAELDSLRLEPTLEEMANVLLHPFMDRLKPVIDYIKSDEGLAMPDAVLDFAQKVAIRCLELSFKGKMFRKICETFPTVKQAVEEVVFSQYRIGHEDVPSWTEAAVPVPCIDIESKLSRDAQDAWRSLRKDSFLGTSEERVTCRPIANGAASQCVERCFEYIEKESDPLGEISQESLSRMILLDEMTPLRSRRRRWYSAIVSSAPNPMLPDVYEVVGAQIKSIFGAKSPVTATFMTHAIINNNQNLLRDYVGTEGTPLAAKDAVPITLDHFRILASLGHYPSSYLFQFISQGADFYDNASEYGVKKETKSPEPCSLSCGRSKKRPRRSAAHSISYAVPGSDDELVGMNVDQPRWTTVKDPAMAKRWTNLSKWLDALEGILRSEQRKLKDYRKKMEDDRTRRRVRVYKTEFMKSLASQIATLRQTERSLHLRLYGEHESESSDEYDDDDYHYSLRKRPRT